MAEEDNPVYDGVMFPKFPPLVLDVTSHMEAIRQFGSRDSDLLLCAYPKTGTNWTFEILCMLLQGDSEYCPHYKGSRMMAAVDLNTLNEMKDPRILNTHVPFGLLPKKHIENGYRIIHVLRNPKDVMVSSYNHFVRDPYMISADFPGTWDNFFLDQCSNTHNFYGGYLKYEKEWETAKNTGKVTNVHTTFYEDMKKYPVREISRLAKYLGVELKDELIEEIAEKCSFKSLSKVVATVKGDLNMITSRSVDGSNFLFRKGIIGDWKNWFTVAQNEKFEALLEKEMKESKLRFTYEC